MPFGEALKPPYTVVGSGMAPVGVLQLATVACGNRHSIGNTRALEAFGEACMLGSSSMSSMQQQIVEAAEGGIRWWT